MTIKKLFDKTIPYSVLSSKDIGSLGEEVESSGNITQRFIQKNRFLPAVDYSNPANFAFYGSAEEYYKSSLHRVLNQYPYDGSLKERTKYLNESTYFDLYIFENMYPRRTGYVTISENGWGPLDFKIGILGVPENIEYIEIKGGPHAAPPEYSNKSLAQQFPEANIYEPSENRESNLKFDLTEGVTVETWLKKEALIPLTETIFETIFHMTNDPSGTDTSGSFMVVLNTSMTGPTDGPIHCEIMSDGVSIPFDFTEILTVDLIDGNWHHLAFTFYNSGSALVSKGYMDGKLKETIIKAGDARAPITGSLIANIGAFRPITNATWYAPSAVGIPVGAGKLSGSLDEFRYWKTTRTSEQIGRYWFTQVGGGTNTDEANTDLGAYYKFNEGITGIASTDSMVLDYSGRISNGSWVGYSADARSTGSAIDSYLEKESEFKDPIIYASHPAVVALQTSLNNSGSLYDLTNNSSLYYGMPSWIVEEDETEGTEQLLKLTQIMGSYLDTLQLQIQSLPKLKDITYDFANNKPIPFAEKFLQGLGFVAPEIFVDSSILAQVLNRSEDIKFDLDLEDIKSLIYKNVYNNLVNIYKAKGTEKAFRNLIHCYGVDEDLIRLNLYGDKVSHELRDNFRYTSLRKKYIDFNHPDRFGGTVYQQTASGNPNSTSFITASNSVIEGPTAFTLESEIIFPYKLAVDENAYFPTPFLTASLFGFHSALAGDNFTWATAEDASIQVYATRPERESDDVFFDVTWSFASAGSIIAGSMRSELFYDVYDNQKWNFALKYYPERYGVDLVSGSYNPITDLSYILELYGVNSEAGIVVNEFSLTQSIGAAPVPILNLLPLVFPKRIFAGAHRQSFTGSLLTPTDIKLGAVRYWTKNLDNKALILHSRDPSNYGTYAPYKSTYLYPTTLEGVKIPEMATLALNWGFDSVTGSGISTSGIPNTSDAGFEVPDLSSGSLDLISRYNWLGKVVEMQHPGRGDFFLPDQTKVVDTRFIYADKQRMPEVLQSSDMVSIEETDNIFTRDSRPIDYYYAFEKSMYQNISDEMLNVFATIVEFNNLIGEPVNRYRRNYKNMEKLRQLFFESIENTPDLDKFIEFYKWIDASLDVMLLQLIPASANVSDDIRTMVESHVLERNKYQAKFPTLEFVRPVIEGGAKGINESLYNWKFGHAPLPSSPLPQNKHCFWWKERAERDEAPLASGNPEVDYDRDQYLSASLQVLNRSFTTPYKFTVDREKVHLIHGGVNYYVNKKIGYVKSKIKFGTDDGVLVYDVQPPIDCIDVYDQNKKIKLAFAASSSVGKGDMYVPFSLYSSSLYNDITPGSRITNLHADTYGNAMDIPMQGPFTEDLVGGLQSRHVAPLSTGVLPPTQFSNTKAIYLSSSGLAPGDAGAYLRIESPSWNVGQPDATNNLSVSGWYKWAGDFPSSPDGAALWGQGGIAGGGSANAGTRLYWRSDNAWVIKEYWDLSSPAPQGIWTSSVGSPGLVADEWTHIVWVHDAGSSPDGGSTPVLYVNGVSVGPLNDDAKPCLGTYSSPGSTRISMIGLGGNPPWSSDYQSAYTGSVDEWAFWKRSLSPTEVAKIYNEGCAADLTAVAPDSLVTWLRMGDGPGDTGGDGGIIHDVVGTSNATGSGWNYPDPATLFPSFVTNVIPGCFYSSTGPRLEGWKFENNKFTYPDVDDPRGVYYREPLSKRPVNIQNKKVASLGNYSQDYEIFQTCGRTSNNLAIVSATGSEAAKYNLGPVKNPFLWSNPNSDNAKIQRGAHKNIFVNRFSAPGGFETAGDSDGGPGLDVYSAEFSVYNSMNWRNSQVRKSLNLDLSSHVNPFGLFSAGAYSSGTVSTADKFGVSMAQFPLGSLIESSSVNALNYEGTGSRYQVNRNPAHQSIITGYPSLPRGPTFSNSGSLFERATGNTFLDISNVSYDFDLATAAEFTATMWFKTTDVDGGQVAGLLCSMLGTGAPYRIRYAIYTRNNMLSANVGVISANPDSGAILTGQVINDGEWHFVALVANGGVAAGPDQFALFLDGVLYGPVGISDPIGTYSFLTAIGCPLQNLATPGPTSFAWGGEIDDVSIWKRALDGAELEAIYNTPSTAPLGLFQQAPNNLVTNPALAPVTDCIGYWLMGDNPVSLASDIPDERGVQNAVGVTLQPFLDPGHPGTIWDHGAPILGSHKVYDNYYVQHAIPRTDYGYAWISASVIFDPAVVSSADMTFVSSSDVGSWLSVLQDRRYYGPDKYDPIRGLGGTGDPAGSGSHWIPVDFAGLNSNIYDPVQYNATGNVLGVEPYFQNSFQDYAYKGGLIWALGGQISGSAKLLNGLINHRQGCYGWPTWKQIRTGEHPIVRSWNSRTTIDDDGWGIHQNYFCWTTKEYGPTVNPDQPNVQNINNCRRGANPWGTVVKYPGKPATYTVLVDLVDLYNPVPLASEEKEYTTEIVTLQFEYLNNLHDVTFKTERLFTVLPKCTVETTAYPFLSSLYLNGAINSPNNPISGFVELVYKKALFPSPLNTFSINVRTRLGFKNTYWKTERDARTTLGFDKFGDD